MSSLLYLIAVLLMLCLAHLKLSGHRGFDVGRVFPEFPLIICLYFLFAQALAPFELYDTTIFVLIVGICGFSLGASISFREVSFSSVVSRDSARQYLKKSFPVRYTLMLYTVGLFFTLLIWSSSGVPLLANDIDAARALASSNGYIGQLSTVFDLAAIGCASFLISCGKEDRGNVFYFMLLLLLGFVVVAFLDGSRSRILKLIVPSLILRHYLYKPMQLRDLAVWLVVGFFFASLIGFYRDYSRWGYLVFSNLGGSSLEWQLFEVLNRYGAYEFWVALYGLQEVVANLPDVFNFKYGALHLGPFLEPFQIDIPTPGEFFKDIVGGNWSGFGLAATIFAPMYADFGVGGVLVFSVYYGLVFRFFHARIFRKGSIDPYYLITYSVIFFFFITGIRTNILSFEFLWFTVIASSFGAMRKY